MTTYCDLADVKLAVEQELSDAADDIVLTAAIETASRQVDAICGRFFYQDATVQERTYWPGDRRNVFVDDISTTVGLLVKLDTAADGTYVTTLAEGTDFVLTPTNAAARTPVRPYEAVRLLGTHTFSTSYRPSVEITARFGWPAVPDAVKSATILQAVNVWRASRVNSGSYSFADEGAPIRQSSVSPHARAMLEQFVRHDEINDG